MIITPKIQQQVENAVLKLEHGIITLSLHIRAGQLSRYIICREESFIDSEELPTHNDSVLKKELYRIKNVIHANP